jgi:predicted RND superfamily exporter protein
VWCALLAAMLGGVVALRVSTDIILWFPKGTEIRDDYEAVREQLSGISPVNVVLKARGDRAVTVPEAIRAIDALASWLESQPEVGRTLAVTDPLRQLHRVLSYGEASGLPESEELVEQYLLVLEGVDYMQDVITEDHMGANILLRVDDNGSDRLVALGDRIERWWVENGPTDYSVETTGLMYEFGRSEEMIAYGQATGLAVALLAIGAVLLFILRIPRHALVALVPNAVPLILAFGLMGILGIALDAATVCLGSLALGIAVDDTIHLMTGYTDLRSSGEKPLVALDRCMTRVLPALVFTTAAIIAGFAVLGLSEFTLIRNLGLVTSGLVFLCLWADLTLLPPLLLLSDRRSL